MYVKVKRRADIGVAEEDADGLVVAFPLDAAGGERVPQAVETYLLQVQFLQQPVEVATVRAGLCGHAVVRHDKEVPPDDLLQRADHREQPPRHRYLSGRADGLGLADEQFRMSAASASRVYPLNRPAYADDTQVRVDVVPLETADLADAQARAQADEDTEVAERKILPHVRHQKTLLAQGQHLDLPLASSRGKDYVNRMERPVPVLGPVTEDHPEDDHHILNRLAAQSGCELFVDEGLHFLFQDIFPFSEDGKDVDPQQEGIRSVGGFLDILFLVGFPKDGDIFECGAHF